MVNETGGTVIVSVLSRAPTTMPIEFCSVSLTLLSDDDRQTILGCEIEYLFQFCLEAIREGHVLRLDLPHDAEEAFELHTLREPSDVIMLLNYLARSASSDWLYPFSIWLVPETHALDTFSRVDEFQEAKHDASLFARVLANGAQRLAVFPSSFDLTLRCDQLKSGIDRVMDCARMLQSKLEWAGEAPEELRILHPIP